MNIKTLLKIGLVIAAITLVFAASDAHARPRPRPSHGGGGGGHHHPPRPHGGSWRPNSYGKASLEGKCKHVGKYCVTFSKNSCGNFYVNGYHFGGSQARCVLYGKCPTKNGGGGNPRPPVYTTTGTRPPVVKVVTKVGTSSLEVECTPSVDCPDEEDLGDIIQSFSVNPSISNTRTNTCPLFWLPGQESGKSKITCKVYTGSTSKDVPKSPRTEGFPDGYPIPVGRHELVCVRTTVNRDVGTDDSVTVSTSTEESRAQVECKQNPAIREV